MNQLTFKLEYKNSVLVTDFCESMMAISDEYNRVKANIGIPDGDAYDIYIDRIESGSIVAYLQEYGPYAIALAEGFNTTFEFVKNLNETIQWLKCKTGAKPDLDPEQLDNIIRFVSPVTRDSSSSITLAGNTFHGPVNIYLNSKEGSEVRSNAESELGEMGRTKLEIHKKVILRWYQARNDPKSKSGDRAIIDTIYNKSIRTVFVSDGLKAQLIESKDNPFKLNYLVDVAIETIGGRPIKYQIIEIHGAIG